MDLVNGSVQGQDTNVSIPGNAQNASNSTPPETRTQTQEAETGRTFRQQEVNDIVRRAKADAIESYRRNQDAQRTEQQDAKWGADNAPVRQASPSQSFDNESIKQYAADAAKQYVEQVRQDALRQSEEQAAQRTVQNFWSKVLPGREKYEDFDTVVGDINFQAFPSVVQLLGGHTDNSSDVLYYLGSDRFKLNELESLAQRSPNDAIKAVQRLAKQLQDNEHASKVRLPNEPLSQMRPSNTGTDKSAMSVSDYRKKYKV